MTNHKFRILLVEDDFFFQTFLKSTLSEKFDIVVASNISEAHREIQREIYDLYLIDILLPDGNGLELCSYIKSQESFRTKPVLLLSSKDEINDKVTGLEFGADDYIAKPCHPKELIARINANLRKLTLLPQDSFINVMNYRIDYTKQCVYDPSGNSIELTSLEFRLLSYFAKHIDHNLSRNQILESVWTDKLNVTERTIDTHISNLRKKLGNLGKLIKSVHGSGYCFTFTRKINPKKNLNRSA